MKKYRVITPTNTVCYDEFVQAKNEQDAINQVKEKIRANHRMTIIYCCMVEEVA